MSISAVLGDRMKGYEALHRTVLPRRAYTLLRLDGRAFHTYLRDADKPFDMQFVADMQAVAEALCGEIGGAVFAYTQSDEISLLITDFDSVRTQPWFGGVTAKVLSVSASLATAVLNTRRPGRLALFDARVFTLPDPVEVANYFLWRQRDAVRNSLSMAARTHFSQKRLHRVGGNEVEGLLRSEAGVHWNDYPATCKRGSVTVRCTGELPVEYVDRRTNESVRTTAIRSWWESDGAPHFTADPKSWLTERIPVVPSLLD